MGSHNSTIINGGGLAAEIMAILSFFCAMHYFDSLQHYFHGTHTDLPYGYFFPKVCAGMIVLVRSWHRCPNNVGSLYLAGPGPNE